MKLIRRRVPMDEYQVALWPGSPAGGERECEDRWELMEPHLVRSGVALDVGSNLGFFTIRAAESRPDLAVVSLEASEGLAERQAAILRARGTQRVCLVRGGLDAATAVDWAETCDVFDATFVLAVAHWFDDPTRTLRALSDLSGQMFVELPDAADVGACGDVQRALWGSRPDEWLAAVCERPVRVLGRIARHTGPIPSWLMLVDGPVTRQPTLPYRGCRYVHPDGRDYRIEIDGAAVRILIRGSAVIRVPGVNVANLMHAGSLVSPPIKWWKTQGAEVFQGWSDHRDPAAHNMLWGSSGLTLIDGDDLHGYFRSVRGSWRTNLRDWRAGRPYRSDVGRWKKSRLLDAISHGTRLLVPARWQRPFRSILRRTE